MPGVAFGPPVFKPGDTVLVEVSLPGENNGTAPTGQNNYNYNNNGNNNNQNASQNGNQNSPPLSGNSQQLSQLTPQQQQLLQQQLAQQQGMNNQRPQEQPQQPIEELQADEKQQLKDLVDLVRLHNPYLLDSSGELQLPGIPSMALAGLTEDLATRRAGAEPALAKLQVRLTRLPLQKSGQAANSSRTTAASAYQAARSPVCPARPARTAASTISARPAAIQTQWWSQLIGEMSSAVSAAAISPAKV